MDHYDHKKIEKKWQDRWEREKPFHAGDKSKKEKRYILDMFPYPSAEGLHVGHPEGYTASDIYSRYLRMKGFEVLHPMGFDAFGLPAENYALKTGTHPAITTEKNIENMRRQIKSLGFSYDWEREVITADPHYYKWTQWIFLQLFKHGLTYEADAPINWCPKDKTGLANEEVIDGKCERCGTPVTKKKIKQWLVKITDERYIGRLLNDLDRVDWPENIKLLQRNWIGKSVGAEIDFAIKAHMPKKAVILHGYGGDPDTGWKAWLIPLLQKAGVEIRAPRLPGDEHPDLATHIKILEKLNIDEETVLVGHSLGCVTAMEYIQKQKVAVAHLVLVAPPFMTVHPKDVPPYPSGVSNYSTWEFNFTALARLSRNVTVIADLEDDKVPLAEPRELAKMLNARLIEEVAPRRHFANRKLGPYQSWTILNTVAPGLEQNIRVFTTRPDTLFGATYMVLSPEHPMVDHITTPEQRGVVERYKKEAAAKSDLERTDLAKEKTGVFTGAYAVNPVNNKEIPVWIADYVLSTYGTGAIMAVPAHDERDFEFAKKYKLPIVKVIKPPSLIPKSALEVGASAGGYGHLASDTESTCWTGDGTMMNSGEYDGMDSVEFQKKIAQWLQKENKGRFKVQYKLRDWLFSRQRYWGEPIPIIHCSEHGHVAVPENKLPVELPDVKKYEPTGTGESPLANIKEWVNVKCPKCGKPAKRETNTMPQWAGSNWYFLRYCDSKNTKKLADPKKLEKWLPIDLYVGGAEHAVLHLLYARFIYKFLCDIEVVPKSFVKKHGDEPFMKLKNQGLILGEDGQKMSKSRGNVINPDEVIEKYGADTMRMYEMFMGPFEDAKPWSTQGIVGVRRFLDKAWNTVIDRQGGRAEERKSRNIQEQAAAPAMVGINRRTHQLIKKITDDIEHFKFNTAVAEFMKYINAVGGEPVQFSGDDVQVFAQLLSPFAPHLAEELWKRLGRKQSISQEPWPTFDPQMIVEDEITIVVQVNGKVRDQLKVSADISEEEAKKLALESQKVQKWLEGKEVKKVIYVRGRLLSIVA